MGETLEYLYDQLYNFKPLCQQIETCYIHIPVYTTSCLQFMFIACIIIMYRGISNEKIFNGTGKKTNIIFKHLHTDSMNY